LAACGRRAHSAACVGTSYNNHRHDRPTITSTLLAAGFETTVTTLGWILYELATHPDEQRQLRDEIHSAQAANRVGDAEAVNFDALPFLNAVIKVNPSRICELDSRLNMPYTVRSFRSPCVTTLLSHTFSAWQLATKLYH
jgi:hypothetical protein